MKKFFNKTIITSMTFLLIGGIILPQNISARENKENGEHLLYLNGYSDNTIRPENYITREEAASILDRITENHKMNRRLYKYEDVKEDRWSHKSIIDLSNKGGIEGYPDGKFRPENYITRAEAVTMISRLEGSEENNDLNLDEVKDHWAKKNLEYAVEKGWLRGYEDKSIKPDEYITRAEFVSIVNRVKNRKTESKNILNNEIKHFKDLDEKAWWYEDIVEASNSHTYKRLEDGSEKWISIIDREL